MNYYLLLTILLLTVLIIYYYYYYLLLLLLLLSIIRTTSFSCRLRICRVPVAAAPIVWVCATTASDAADSLLESKCAFSSVHFVFTCLLFVVFFSCLLSDSFFFLFYFSTFFSSPTWFSGFNPQPKDAAQFVAHAQRVMSSRYHPAARDMSRSSYGSNINNVNNVNSNR